jgi:NAD(P)H-flavin reductase
MYEFHPATISSAPHEKDVTVHFRVRGGWTKRLALRAAAAAARTLPEEGSGTMSPPVPVHVAIQGPFGNLSMNVLDDAQRYPHVLLIGGGIGVTPLRSLLRHLLYAHQKLGQRRHQIHLVWVVSNVELVHALPILPEEDNDDDEVMDDHDDTFFSPHRIMNRNNNNSKKHISQEMLIDDDVPTKKKSSSSSLSKYHHSDTVLLGIDDGDDDDGEVLTDREYYRGEYHRDNEEPTDSMTSEPSSSSFSSAKGSDGVKRARTKDNKALVRFDIYVTQDGSSSTSASLPHPKSRSGVVDVRYHWGRRPDVSTLFTATADHVKQLHRTAFVSGHTSHVAVLACGPAQLVAAAKRAARTQSDAAVAFDFHEEVFEY